MLLVFPHTINLESAMTWQAVDRMRYSMVDEGGPGGSSSRAGNEAPGQSVIEIASLPADLQVSSYGARESNTITPAKIADVRSALHNWGVTMVVIPDNEGLPYYEQIPSVTIAAALITAATGRLPVYADGAWVWKAVNHLGPSIVTTSAKFSLCTSAGSRGRAAVDAALACVRSEGPFVRIVSPANGSVLAANDSLVTTVADTVPVERADFQITGKDITGSLSIPARPFVYGSLSGFLARANAVDLPNGIYTLRGFAYDAEGVVGRSAAVTVRVDDH